MTLVVNISQRAMSSMGSLPRKIQVKARRAVELLKTDNEKSIKPNKLEGGRNLYSGRLNKRFRLIYSKNNNMITIVDFIKIDDVSNVMRSET